jgi:hypothetical protein
MKQDLEIYMRAIKYFIQCSPKGKEQQNRIQLILAELHLYATQQNCSMKFYQELFYQVEKFTTCKWNGKVCSKLILHTIETTYCDEMECLHFVNDTSRNLCDSCLIQNECKK